MLESVNKFGRINKVLRRLIRTLSLKPAAAMGFGRLTRVGVCIAVSHQKAYGITLPLSSERRVLLNQI
jgi:hypothetical protein